MRGHRHQQSSSLGRALLFLGSLILLLLTVGSPPVHAQTFADIDPADWYYDAVESLADRGVVVGYEDGIFRPDEPITRAQFAVMVAQLLALEPAVVDVFSDVSPDAAFYGAVGSLYLAEIARGSTGDAFYPLAPLTRQQAASVIMRALAVRAALDPTINSEMLSDDSAIKGWLQGLKDRSFIASDHRGAVASAVRLALLCGTTEGWFYPFVDLTRGQAVGILHRALVLEPYPMPQMPVSVPVESAYPAVGPGSRGNLVLWMERRLNLLTYEAGTAEGTFDTHTGQGVMAFQKIEGLQRTGVMSGQGWARLASAQPPEPKRALGGHRVEIDLTKQVLLVIDDGIVARTIPVATGKEGWRTPTGSFTIQRKLPYWRESYLGFLYKPSYFVGGYAIHGSYSVPPYPASHGCVRVAVDTMDRLYPLLPIGTRVDIYY